MNLWGFAGVSAVLLALMQWLVMPLLWRRVRARPTEDGLPQALLLASAAVLRTLCLAALVASVVALLAAGWGSWRGGLSLESLTATRQQLEVWRDGLLTVSPIWGLLTILVAGTAWVLLARRMVRMRIEAALRAVSQAELERVDKARREGQWEDLPPTPEMEQTNELLRQRFEILQLLDRRRVALGGESQADAMHRARIMKELEELTQLYMIMDYRRRMKIQYDPDRVAMPPPRGWKERLERLFMSEGMMASMSRSTRLLYFTSLVVVVASFVGLNAHGLGQAIERRLLTVSELEISLVEERARATWEEVKGGEKEEAAAEQAEAEPWDEEDEEALDALAAGYEESVARQWRWGHVIDSGNEMRVVTRTSVRQALLKQFAEGREGVRLSPTLSTDPSIRKQHVREAAARYEQSVGEKGPATELGRQFKQKRGEELKKLKRERPETWAAMKSKLRSMRSLIVQAGDSFQQAATSRSIRSVVLGEVLGSAVSPTGPPSETPLAPLIEQLRTSVSAQRLEGALTADGDTLLATLASPEASAEEAFKAVEEADSRRLRFTPAEAPAITAALQDLPTAHELVPSVARSQPGLRRDLDAHLELSEVVPLATELRASEPFNTYESIFPSRENADLNTVSGTLRRAAAERTDSLHLVVAKDEQAPDGVRLSKTNEDPLLLTVQEGSSPPPFDPGGSGGGGGGGGFSGGGGGIGSGGGPHHPNKGGGGSGSAMKSAAFARARNFGALRGFSRIGGVLIGSPPESGSTAADFRDLSWTATDKGVTLSLLRHDGKRISVGPFRKSILEAALAYAADARPVTVTMVTANPLYDLKILLHPTLEDTRLGCRAIELDRFVDEFSFKDSRRKQQTELVQTQGRLYELAWAIRFRELMETLGSKLSPEESTQLEPLNRLAQFYLRYDAQALFAKLPPGASWRDPRSSPLVGKPEHFDTQLVDSIKTCAGKPALFRECVTLFIRRDADQYKSRGDWLLPPPQFQIWSGVREQPYSIDPELAFLRSPQGSADTLWPFQFMLQVAFTSPPRTATSAETLDESEPWMFPTLGGHIQQLVLEGLEKKGAARKSILQDLREFTVAQRFVRAALEGHLGASFPTDKLLALMAEVKVKPEETAFPTARWNAKPGLLEAQFLATLRLIRPNLSTSVVLGEEHEEAMKRLIARVDVCQDVSKGALELERMTDSAWALSCGFSMGHWRESLPRPVRSLVDEAEKVRLTRQLRKQLGVQADFESRAGKACPAVP